jgi:hypothetical protein
LALPVLGLLLKNISCSYTKVEHQALEETLKVLMMHINHELTSNFDVKQGTNQLFDPTLGQSNTLTQQLLDLVRFAEKPD